MSGSIQPIGIRLPSIKELCKIFLPRTAEKGGM